MQLSFSMPILFKINEVVNFYLNQFKGTYKNQKMVYEFQLSTVVYLYMIQLLTLIKLLPLLRRLFYCIHICCSDG